MLDSELQKQINDLTVNAEEIQKKKEELEEKLRTAELYKVTAERIQYYVNYLDSLSNDDISKKGWYFTFGERPDTEDTFIKYKTDMELILPKDKFVFTEIKNMFKETLLKRKKEIDDYLAKENHEQ